MKMKAVLLVYLVLSAEAMRMTDTRFEGAVSDRAQSDTDLNPSVVEAAKAAYNLYASGNCQFLPVKQIGQIVKEMAPLAAAGSGLLAKPALTSTGASGGLRDFFSDGVRMGTKAGLIEQMSIGALHSSGGLGGIATTMGTTMKVLWKLRHALMVPNGVCTAIAKLTPPYNDSHCNDEEELAGGFLPIKMLANPATLFQLWRLRVKLKDPAKLCVLVSLAMPSYSVADCQGQPPEKLLEYFVENIPKLLQHLLSSPEGLPELLRSEPLVVKDLPILLQSAPFLPQKLPKLLATCKNLPQSLPELVGHCSRLSAATVDGLTGVPPGLQLSELLKECRGIPPNIPELLEGCPGLSDVLLELLKNMPKLPEDLPRLLQDLQILPANLLELVSGLPDHPENLPNILMSLPDLPKNLTDLGNLISRLPLDLPSSLKGCLGLPTYLSELATSCPSLWERVPDPLKMVLNTSGYFGELLDACPGLAHDFQQRLTTECPAISGSFSDLLRNLPGLSANLPAEIASLAHLPENILAALKTLPNDLSSLVRAVPGIVGDLTNLPGPVRAVLNDCPALRDNFADILRGLPSLPGDIGTMLDDCQDVPEALPGMLKGLAGMADDMLGVVRILRKGALGGLLILMKRAPEPLRDVLGTCPRLVKNVPTIVRNLPSLPGDLSGMVAGCPNVPTHLPEMLQELAGLPDPVLDGVKSLSQGALSALLGLLLAVPERVRDVLIACPALADNLPNIIKDLPLIPDNLPEMYAGCSGDTAQAYLPQFFEDLASVPDHVLHGVKRLSAPVNNGVPEIWQSVPEPLRDLLTDCPMLVDKLPEIVRNLPSLPEDLPGMLTGCLYVPENTADMLQELASFPAQLLTGLLSPKTRSLLTLVEHMPMVPQSVREVLTHCPDLVDSLANLLGNISGLHASLPEVVASCPHISGNLEEGLTSMSSAGLTIVKSLPYLSQNLPKLLKQLPNILAMLPVLAKYMPRLEDYLPQLLKIRSWLASNLPKLLKAAKGWLRSSDLKNFFAVLRTVPESFSVFRKGLESLPRELAELLRGFKGKSLPSLGNLAELPQFLSESLPNLAVDPGVALAGVAVLLVGVGAFKLWQRRLRENRFGKSFCPTSRWTSNPSLFRDEYVHRTGADRSRRSQQLDDESAESEDAAAVSRRMSPCRGLVQQRAPVKCNASDIRCRTAVCRQLCCNSDTCSMYQFLDEDAVDFEGRVDAGTFDCFLGDAVSVFDRQHCAEWGGFVKYEGDQFALDTHLKTQVLGLTRLSVLMMTRQPAESDIAHTIRSCKAACASLENCLFFQFRIDQLVCWYGDSSFENFQNASQRHPFGGVLGGHMEVSKKSSCPEGEKQCPASKMGLHSRCVKSCSTCAGFSGDGESSCIKTPGQSLCHSSMWSDEYAGIKLDSALCSDLRRQAVVMDEDTGFNGHAVCREMCCGDPECVLYQVYKSSAGDGGLKKGDKVVCWLGTRIHSQVDMFWCEQRRSREIFGRKYEGGYLLERGCSSGYSCLISGECVQSCTAQCPGAPNSDYGARSCTDVGTDMEAAEDADDHGYVVTESHTEYYLHHGKPSPQEASNAADTLLMVAQNRQRLVTPEVVSAQACDALAIGAQGCEPVDGGCKCKYDAPETCDTWFEGAAQVRPVIDEAGLVLLSQRSCQCDTSDQSCHFGLMESVPHIKVSSVDKLEVHIPAGNLQTRRASHATEGVLEEPQPGAWGKLRAAEPAPPGDFARSSERLHFAVVALVILAGCWRPA